MSFYFKEKLFQNCPACGSSALEQMNLGSVIEGDLWLEFVKRPLRFFRVRRGVSLQSQRFQMCCGCGFVFRQDSADSINEFLAKYAKDLTNG